MGYEVVVAHRRGRCHGCADRDLENLFKPPSKFAPKTVEEYDAKLDALAATITWMDPHVLAVQEVGDPVALRELTV